jgi:ParB-like chromosome segregation protein Spo0J
MRSQAQDLSTPVPFGANAVVPIGSLQAADSPRLSGENCEHAHALAETYSVLPPILVHRDTMRVIDGMHRLRAAMLNGCDEIGVQFFDGTDDDAFVAAVRANVMHGLPLAPADREAAATRILASHPQWSDRAIAEAVGLAAQTVARIRSSSTDQASQLNARIGRDGRLRPLSSAAGRRIAGRVIAHRPEASLREIAKEAGISLATARDVRERVGRGNDPVPPRQARAEQKNATAQRGAKAQARGRVPGPGQLQDKALTLQKLQRDPSIRLTDAGRLLLRWLAAHAIRTEDWEDLQADIPAHSISLVADLALGYSEEWKKFAEALKKKACAREQQAL